MAHTVIVTWRLHLLRIFARDVLHPPTKPTCRTQVARLVCPMKQPPRVKILQILANAFLASVVMTTIYVCYVLLESMDWVVFAEHVSRGPFLMLRGKQHATRVYKTIQHRYEGQDRATSAFANKAFTRMSKHAELALEDNIRQE